MMNIMVPAPRPRMQPAMDWESIRWSCKRHPFRKIILALAGYGYDWPASTEATTITYQQALAGARQYNATINFDNTSYNNGYQYTDGDGIKHQVYFADAATNFNTMRFADEYGTAGTALWRLGSEDDRLWAFYGRNLSNEAMQKIHSIFQFLIM